MEVQAEHLQFKQVLLHLSYFIHTLMIKQLLVPAIQVIKNELAKAVNEALVAQVLRDYYLVVVPPLVEQFGYVPLLLH